MSSIEEITGVKRADTVIRRFNELELTNVPMSFKTRADVAKICKERNPLNERAAIKTYLSKNNDYWRELIETNVRKISSMTDECRLVICIPAFHEESRIYGCLNAIYGQDINRNLFEVIVCENTEADLDSTGSLVVQYRDDMELENLHLITVKFPESKGGVGPARKLATDIALQRSISRENQIDPLYIYSEDADLSHFTSEGILLEIVRRLDRKPYLDGMVLKQDKCPDFMRKNDVFFLSQRATEFYLSISASPRFSFNNRKEADFKYNRILTRGSGSIFPAEVLAMINGYDLEKSIKGEDNRIGEMISIMRGYPEDGIFTPQTLTIEGLGSSLRSNTSPRRFLDGLVRLKGENPYSKFGEPANERALREASDDSVMNKLNDDIGAEISDENKYLLEKELSKFREYFDSTTGEDANKMFIRLMFFLGFKQNDFKVIQTNKNSPDNNREYSVQITDLKNVKRYLKKIRNSEK